MQLDATLFKLLIDKDPAKAAKLIRGIANAVQRSYDADRIRDVRGHAITTEAEKKRRVGICIDYAKLLRADFGWSLDRIVDVLPRALQAKLDGGEFDVDAETRRSAWVG